MIKRRFLPAFLAVSFFMTLPALAGSSALSTAPAPPVQALPASSAPVSESMDAQRVWLDEITGVVLYKKAAAADFSPARKGASLSAGDTLKTGEGSCEIVFDDKSRLSITPDTEIVITEALKNIAANTRSTLLRLQIGKLKAKITKVTPGSRFEITTPSAVAAVRGTTLILQSLLLNGRYISHLYVDESKSGVLFTNTESGDSEFVPAFSDSSSSSDGTIEEPEKTAKEEQDQYNEGFEGESSDGVMEDPFEDPADPSASSGETDDAELDKESEQNTSGGAAQDATEEAAEEAGIDTSAQDEAERLLISQEIAIIRNDLDFSHADANLAQISDAQTGKVMTDVHGNRVRVDQYVFKETQGKGQDVVRFLSLSLRTGEYQNGVTSVLFGALFNTSITVPLRDLPWNEYLNVVTGDEFNAAVPISPYVEQYIVHEGADATAATGPSLYPTQFFVEFGNPRRPDDGRDIVGFEEFYSAPYKADSLAQGGTNTFWVQKRTGELTIIKPYGGSIQTFYGSSDGGGDGSQTANFAQLFDTSKLTPLGAINYYRNLPSNSSPNTADHEHPAYFEDIYGGKSLIGVFIPINDSGGIIDQPGFRLQGMRDLLSPNPEVNGGNYNLEVLFFYGTNDTKTGLFQEEFRIDAIITPEILTDLGTVNQSTVFPAQLYPDDDGYAV